VDEKIILNHGIESLEMNFLKELSIKNTVVIHESILEKEYIFSITKEDKSCFALQLNLK
jgi:hypothetical protein